MYEVCEVCVCIRLYVCVCLCMKVCVYKVFCVCMYEFVCVSAAYAFGSANVNIVTMCVCVRACACVRACVCEYTPNTQTFADSVSSIHLTVNSERTQSR